MGIKVLKLIKEMDEGDGIDYYNLRSARGEYDEELRKLAKDLGIKLRIWNGSKVKDDV